ncbi:unnamed protein product [Ophioblennius macclurei]
MSTIWTLVASLEVVCFAVLGSAEDSSNSTLFLISAPEVLHAGTPTSLAVTVLADFPGTVTAGVDHPKFRFFQTQDFQGGLTTVLTLPSFPGFAPHNSPLNLTVRGYRGEIPVFTENATLGFSLRNVSSFVQTDRSRYEPGDTVRVRIVSVQLDNRPYEGRIDVSAQDPSGNVVDRWASTGSRGIVTRGFSLSERAPFGQWSIKTTVNGVTDEKTFTVGRYERPQFDVLIKTPSRILAGDGISGSVRAAHPSGQPVHGTLVVTVTSDPLLASSLLPTQTKEIYGSVQFSFSEEELGSLRPRETVHVTACVTDGLTGVKLNKTVEVRRTENAFQLKFHNYPSTLKPSLHFSANLSVSRYDGKPLTSMDLTHPLVVKIAQNTSVIADESETLTFGVPRDGNVQIKFRLRAQVTSLYVQARFQSGEETLRVYTDSSPTDSYIQISPINNLPALIGFPFNLDVESTFQITNLHFVVSSKGRVVTAGTSNSSSFYLTPALSWSPEACVTIYCILSDREVISDTAHVPVNQHNSLSLSWSRDRAQPGKQVSLILTALEPGSQVGVVVMGLHDDSPLRADLDFKIEPECDLRMLTNTGRSYKNQQYEPETEESVLMVQKYWSSWTSAAEPLLWLDADVSGETWTSEDIKVPDGVTSLGALALVMSENLGLLFTPVPLKLAVSKDFSLSLDVPPHLIRGEEIVLEVNVVNHLEQNINVIVLIAQSDTFEFVLSRRSNVSVINAQRLTLGSHMSAPARFPIRTLSLGEMEITVDAVSAESSESLVRSLIVKPEGFEQIFSQTLFLELGPVKNFSSTSVSFSFPPDVVPGSQKAHVALVGDVLALSLNNMHSLVRMPLGCGEQNMIHFAPSAYVLHYLNKSTHDDSEIRSRALSYLKESYSKQLSYRRDDGSFSAFGSSDASGSTWLTAFVLRCFVLAKQYTRIDQNVLDAARTWLVERQGPDGEFGEAGTAMHTEMREGVDGDSVALTAYVLVALLEDGTFACTGKSTLDVMQPNYVTLAQKYLENKVSIGGVGNYSLALVAYALALTGSPFTETALDELNRRADYIDGVKMWNTFPGSSSHDQQSHSTQIEMVSYVLLALLSRGGFVEGITLMKWLTKQLSPFGGYGTTQDTMIAIQALVCYAVNSGADTIDLNLNISAPTSPSASLFRIDSTNYRERQSREMTAERDLHLNIYMEGKGFAIFQLNVFHNVETRAASRVVQRVKEAFALSADLTDNGNLDRMILTVCTKLKDNEAINSTGMAIMDVGMLSGFALFPGAAVTADLVRKVEITADKISLYLDSLTKSQVCFQLPIIRKYKVARTQDAVVLVYDYYEPTRRATASYNSPELRAADSCFFCGENCEDCIPGMTITYSSPQTHSSSGVAPKISCLFVLFAALHIVL